MTDKIGQIVRDITTLEVNTVLKHEMTARKMPKPRYALYEIANTYASYMQHMPPQFRRKEVATEIYSNKKTFDNLIAAAKAGIEVNPSEDASEKVRDDYQAQHIMLKRIKCNCEEILNIVGQVADSNDAFFKEDKPNLALLKAFDFKPEHILRIRKIWDLGTGNVVMQTCVQIDGDVFTRLQPQFASSNEKNVALMKIHKEGVEISIGLWKDLMVTISTFITKGLAKLF